MRVNCAVVLVCGYAMLLLSAPASAQIQPTQPSFCYVYLTANDLGVDLGVPAPPTAVLVDQNTVPGEEGLSIYRLPSKACVPPCSCPQVGASAGGTSGGGTSGGGPRGGAASGGRPINLATGNTYIIQTDVTIPGLSGGLILSRMWNSLWPQSEMSFQAGLFGPNWRSTYEERVFVGSDDYVKYSRSDGNFWSFAWASGRTYSVAGPANADATLSVDINNTQWTLTFQNGEKRIFNYTSGWLTAIVDRNGNTTQVAYDALNRIVTVTDPGGRHLYFGYQNNSSYLITSVTSDVGISLSYTYDTQGRLTQVTQPDLTTMSFAYDSNSMITTVTDSNGKVLESHTYDSYGRGLTSSKANGVEAVTVSYPNQ